MIITQKRSLFLRSFALLALLIVAVSAAWSFIQKPVHAATGIPVTTDASDATGRPWLGFGVNWFPEPNPNKDEYAPAAWTDSEFNLDASRLDYLKPAVTRITWHPVYFDPTGVVGQYDWTTTGAQNEFRALDYMKSRGYAVMVGWWETPWSAISTSYTTVVTDFLTYLVKTKGYTNIKYWNGINEPDHRDPTTESNWETMTINTRNALNNAGLSSIEVLGPDTQDADSWITDASSNLNNVLSGYSKHLYPTGEYDISDGSQETATRSLVNTLVVNDPSNKPYFLTEMGDKYGYDSSTDSQPAVTTYAYGVTMADLGVQVARGGAAAPMAWWLDDLNTKEWGMWDSLDSPALRPWFYTWSLLERYVPDGATIYEPAQPSGVRVLAASKADGSNANWTFVLVNTNTSDQAITLRAPGWGAATLDQYSYTSSSQPADSNGFPVPSTMLTGGLDTGIPVTLPANSVITLTTFDTAAVPPSNSSFVDSLDNWSKTYSHSANWTFDATNANAYFEGDTSRAVRSSDTTESIVYTRSAGITDFAAKVSFCCATTDITNRVMFATSTDTTNWTSLSANMTDAIPGGDNWYWTKFTPSGTLPVGTKYLRITFANDTRVYTPQLDQVRISGSSIVTIDGLSDWSYTYNHSANWKFDTTNTQYFNGDASRAERTSDTTETITWSYTNISSFSATVYMCCSSSYTGTILLQVSPDDSTWTTVSTSSHGLTPTGNGGNWYRSVYASEGTVPGGTKYVRLTFANDAHVYSPQLSQIVIMHS